MASIVTFIFHNKKVDIQCLSSHLMKTICENFAKKEKLDINKLCFLYKDKQIVQDFSFFQQANDFDKKRNKMEIKVNEIDSIKTNEIKSDIIICPVCEIDECAIIKFKDYKISLLECINKHYKGNILLENFYNTQKIDLTKIKCQGEGCDNKRSDVYQNEFFKCCQCIKFFCPLCKQKHYEENPQHSIINYEYKYYYSNIHGENFTKYCNPCKKNICTRCVKMHIEHKSKITNFEDLLADIPETEILENKKGNLKIKIEQLEKHIKEVLAKLINYYREVIKNLKIFYDIFRLNIDKFIKFNEMGKRNYQILSNVLELNNYCDKIYKDIDNIINDKSMFNKLSKMINIYKQMTKIEKESSTNLVENNMQFKFKYDITTTNDAQYGVNDIFEVFKSYSNNKEYIISKNNSNNNLDIFQIEDNKKIRSLKGHDDNIRSIRYFINDNNYNEYIITADKSQMVIVWDITNNYNILHKINTKYLHIYSCLLVFERNNRNSIIVSTSQTDKNNAFTKVYSLETATFIKYLKNTNIYSIFYLLAWKNKRDNKNYIIQLANKLIIINSLVDDEIYAVLKNNHEDAHYSGFITNNDNKDLLYSSSINGYINIWDLYNKDLIKTIDANGSNLSCIIKWNDNLIIVGYFLNRTFKIIDLRNDNIITQIKGQHSHEVVCVKKINHPIYGESLLTGSKDNTIKLWFL